MDMNWLAHISIIKDVQWARMGNVWKAKGRYRNKEWFINIIIAVWLVSGYMNPFRTDTRIHFSVCKLRTGNLSFVYSNMCLRTSISKPLHWYKYDSLIFVHSLANLIFQTFMRRNIYFQICTSKTCFHIYTVHWHALHQRFDKNNE